MREVVREGFNINETKTQGYSGVRIVIKNWPSPERPAALASLWGVGLSGLQPGPTPGPVG